MAAGTRRFQAPKGTRDFYPDDMAVRRYIEGVWRQTAINHGFDEVEGPTFEHLELYTHKSGPGIVSEIFHVHSGKDEEQVAAMKKGEAAAPYALRPEFTPTLARMVAARAAELPRPIKWFAIPQMFRAERPQRGRLREHIQWNVDFIGGDNSAKADAELIAVALDALARLGLGPTDLKVLLNDRAYSQAMAIKAGIAQEKYESMRWVRDNFDRIPPERRKAEFEAKGINEGDVTKWIQFENLSNEVANDPTLTPNERAAKIGISQDLIIAVLQVRFELDQLGFQGWHESEAGIVRGLAYYTGTVFEMIAEGERAIAGGGRYDNLIESFGGPSLPACGFGMGDVVLGNLLHDKGLLKEEHYLRDVRPDAFVIAADDATGARLPAIVASLRRERLHIRHSYKSTRNVGKLLGEASKSHARFAVILGKELQNNLVVLKDLASGEQKEMNLNDLASRLRHARTNDR